jgi:hypothetical protein
LIRQEKRDLPDIVKRFETEIEEWRINVLRELPVRPEVAAYHLIATTLDQLSTNFQQLMPHAAAELELIVRDRLFGLQIALAGIRDSDSAEAFTTHLIHGSITGPDARLATRVIDHMSLYAIARDAVLTFGWGGYVVESPSEELLRFLNPPDWPGTRDYAEQMISQEIDNEVALSLSPMIGTEEAILEHALERTIDLPMDLPLGGLSAKQFITAHVGLSTLMASRWLQGEVPITEHMALTDLVKNKSNLELEESERFLDLIKFDRTDLRLSLFHCPLVPLTQSSAAVIVPGLVFGRPSAVIPRLAVLRGPGLDSYSESVEDHLLEKLRAQFKKQDVTIKTKFPYSFSGEQGDLDLVIHEGTNNRVLIAEVKAFIRPDTVEEVIRANQKLEEGLNQIKRAKKWLTTLNPSKIGEALQIPGIASTAKIHFDVIGNGFAGSDYLPIPDGVKVVNAHYLLLPRFKGGWILDAIDAFQGRLETAMGGVNAQDRLALQFGKLRLELPGRRIAV